MILLKNASAHFVEEFFGVPPTIDRVTIVDPGPH